MRWVILYCIYIRYIYIVIEFNKVREPGYFLHHEDEGIKVPVGEPYRYVYILFLSLTGLDKLQSQTTSYNIYYIYTFFLKFCKAIYIL